MIKLLTFIIALSIIMVSYRVVRGPTVFDRILAVNVIGTKTILLLSLISFYDSHMHFLDIGLGFALLNFTGTVAILRYLMAVKINHEIEKKT